MYEKWRKMWISLVYAKTQKNTIDKEEGSIYTQQQQNEIKDKSSINFLYEIATIFFIENQ